MIDEAHERRAGLHEEWAQFAAPLEAQRDELRGIGGPEREAMKVRDTLRFPLSFLFSTLVCLLPSVLRREWNGASLKFRCQRGCGIAIQGQTDTTICSCLKSPARRACRGTGGPEREAKKPPLRFFVFFPFKRDGGSIQSVNSQRLCP